MHAVDNIRAVAWEDDAVVLIDQRALPEAYVSVRCRSAREVARAIAGMVVRGAPAIGIAAAYGAALGARHGALDAALEDLEAARPTAVNLRWALQRMRRAAGAGADSAALLAEARRMHAEDLAANHRMAEIGAAYLPASSALLTHCNTGSLATGGYGTALGVVRQAWADGRVTRVYAGETRPWLQGARLTAWELAQDSIPVSILADAAAPSLLRTGEVSWVIVGADRISANGDVANKIGTYALALAARAHGVGFMVVAPSATVDVDSACGDDIPIELRDEDEVLGVSGQRLAPQGASAWNPVFDITPAALVDVLVTERGAVERPDAARLQTLLAEPERATAG